MKKKLFLSIALMVATASIAQSVFINEIHYDNAGGDVNEGFEIAGPAGTDMSGWTVVLYNGSNSSTYNTISLSGVIADQSNGFGTQWYGLPSNGMQNGAPDGLALVESDGTTVAQFLNYEGSTITAANGPASGMTSTNIGVSETNSTPVGESLQLIGSGTEYSDFTWNAPAAASNGDINVGQTFIVPGPPPPTGPTLDYTFCSEEMPLEFNPPIVASAGVVVADSGFPSDTGLIGTGLGEYVLESVVINVEGEMAEDVEFYLQPANLGGAIWFLGGGAGGTDGMDTAVDLAFTDSSSNNYSDWTGGAPAADYLTSRRSI